MILLKREKKKKREGRRQRWRGMPGGGADHFGSGGRREECPRTAGRCAAVWIRSAAARQRWTAGRPRKRTEGRREDGRQEEPQTDGRTDRRTDGRREIPNRESRTRCRDAPNAHRHADGGSGGRCAGDPRKRPQTDGEQRKHTYIQKPRRDLFPAPLDGCRTAKNFYIYTPGTA